MSGYFKSVKVSNYRSFKKLSIDGFRRFNIFGGLNGVGKSTLLETLFLSVDLNNPGALTKPFDWRDAEYPSRNPAVLIPNISEPGLIEVGRSVGKLKIELQATGFPDSERIAMPATIQSGQAIRLEKFNTPNQLGILLKAQEDENSLESFVLGIGGEPTGTKIKGGSFSFPDAVIFNSGARISAIGAAEMLSGIIKEERMPELVDYMRSIQPNLSEFFLLQEGLSPVIYAKHNGTQLPVNLLGDGFKNLFWTVIALMNIDRGIFFLDELDTALHFSIVSKYWKCIAEIASKEDCQIFTTSHSREAILSLASGVNDAGMAADDLAYFRLERENEEHKAVQYSLEDMRSADEFNLEFR